MKYSLFLSNQASQEIIESIDWYNLEKKKPGFEYYDEVKAQLTLVVENPKGYPIRFKSIRTTRVKRFPYLIYFRRDEKDASLHSIGNLAYKSKSTNN